MTTGTTATGTTATGTAALTGDAARDALLDLRDILFECAETDRDTIARAVAEIGRAHDPDPARPGGYGGAYAALVADSLPGEGPDLAARIDAIGVAAARERLAEVIEALMAAGPGPAGRR